MTITVRIQYKGEGARKLAAEEHSPDRDVALRYEEDMNRALSMFQIPVPPDSSRAIWKSGFVLCNYATTRDTVGAIKSDYFYTLISSPHRIVNV